MRSKITSKYQVTIPRSIRDRLKLSVSDAIEWRIDGDAVVVEPVRKPFLRHKGAIAVGAGDVRKDIATARRSIATKRQ